MRVHGKIHKQCAAGSHGFQYGYTFHNVPDILCGACCGPRRNPHRPMRYAWRWRSVTCRRCRALRGAP